MNKLLIVCGPTATGKTSLGLKLAKEFNGEIVSADSRQVYQGMDIGTGKDLPVNSKLKTQNSKLKLKTTKFNVGYRLKDGVPVWLVDTVRPDYRFNVGEYVKLAKIVIADIQSRKKLPIVVGGTGLYIKALVEPLNQVSIPPNSQLRKELEQISVEKLQEELIKLNREKFAVMNNSDQKNPRRLIRAIEKVKWNNIDHPVRPADDRVLKFYSNILLIGLTTSLQELYRRIEERVDKRVKQGIISEIHQLLDQGYGWNLPSMSALGYKEWLEYFSKQLTVSSSQLKQIKNQVINQWKLHEKQYARRQMTWFKKQKNINWFNIAKPNYVKRILEKVKLWYD